MRFTLNRRLDDKHKPFTVQGSISCINVKQFRKKCVFRTTMNRRQSKFDGNNCNLAIIIVEEEKAGTEMIFPTLGVSLETSLFFFRLLSVTKTKKQQWEKYRQRQRWCYRFLCLKPEPITCCRGWVAVCDREESRLRLVCLIFGFKWFSASIKTQPEDETSL